MSPLVISSCKKKFFLLKIVAEIRGGITIALIYNFFMDVTLKK